MKVAIIKYNAGNIFSVASALQRIGIEPLITADPDLLQSADKIIFPGVGNAQAAMVHLKKERLDQVIKNMTQPVLGICLGMQILCSHSEEGDSTCLGIFDSTVNRFKQKNGDEKIPHVGWNNITNLNSPLLKGLVENDFMYFVHSYYVVQNEYTIATTDYIQPFSAAIAHNNFYATQFHPEKSGSVGESILKNFIDLK